MTDEEEIIRRTERVEICLLVDCENVLILTQVTSTINRQRKKSQQKTGPSGDVKKKREESRDTVEERFAW